MCLQSLVPARFETRTVTGLVKGHAYSVTAVEEVTLPTVIYWNDFISVDLQCCTVTTLELVIDVEVFNVEVMAQRGFKSVKKSSGAATSSDSFNFVFFSVKLLSTRNPKSVWCVLGTLGVKLSGTAPGVTSEEL